MDRTFIDERSSITNDRDEGHALIDKKFPKACGCYALLLGKIGQISYYDTFEIISMRLCPST
jgi:hypothetical protein